MKTLRIDLPLNRVEGDLEVRLDIRDGTVVDAWCSGTLFRGFESVMAGRGHLDGLAITPRICGICSTAHLLAAVRALEAIAGIEPPPEAQRLRNLAMGAEVLQSDARHAFLMYGPDLASPALAARPLQAEAARRYAPLAGTSTGPTLAATRDLIEVVTLVGGRWPHGSYMVPGGLTRGLPREDIQLAMFRVDAFRRWYEARVLGCDVDRWLAVRSASDLDAWLDERPAHRDSEVGFFVRFARDLGLDRPAGGCRNHLSFGSLPVLAGSAATGADGRWVVPPGFARGVHAEPLREEAITEHLAHSWLTGPDEPLAPCRGVTKPGVPGADDGRYTWAKAPRYDGMTAETGPLAEAVLRQDPLFCDLVRAHGPAPLARQLARIVRGATYLPAMQTWLRELKAGSEFYSPPPSPFPDGQGFGCVQATRGALGHWVAIRDERIESYQVVSPTTWNASPRDSEGVRGPLEQALVGTAVADPADPVEVGLVVRSFDPCLVCTVH